MNSSTSNTEDDIGHEGRSRTSSCGSAGDIDEAPRVICRYGRGCTHTDAAHKEAFWHPPITELTSDEFHSNYICNECGCGFTDLAELRLHLQRKTAWSDASLVGCRISCLIENKEWHEGFVCSLSNNSRHLVDFHMIGEKRWLNMKRIAFYIAERPPVRTNAARDSNEYKDDQSLVDENDGLAPIHDMEDWVYCEDISLEYAFAQSVLFKVFNTGGQETGHKTKGHTCLTDGDKAHAKNFKGSLLYGELLPRGANKALGSARLEAGNAKVLYDLGMGTGKIPMQAFLQFPNLEYVYGVELSQGRYEIAEEAALKMVNLLGIDSFHVQSDPGRCIIITEKPREQSRNCRVLHYECGNLFDTRNMESADVIMLETDIPSTAHAQFCCFLNNLKVGARTLSYLDLTRIWSFHPFTFKQLEINKRLSDRFPTSWSVQRGHHFFIWKKTLSGEITPLPTFTIGYESSSRKSHKSRRRHSCEEGADDYENGSLSACLPSFGLFSFFEKIFSGSSKPDPRNVTPKSMSARSASPDVSSTKADSTSLSKARTNDYSNMRENFDTTSSMLLRTAVNSAALDDSSTSRTEKRFNPHQSHGLVINATPREFQVDEEVASNEQDRSSVVAPSTPSKKRSQNESFVDDTGYLVRGESSADSIPSQISPKMCDDENMHTPQHLKSKAKAVDIDLFLDERRVDLLPKSGSMLLALSDLDNKEATMDHDDDDYDDDDDDDNDDNDDNDAKEVPQFVERNWKRSFACVERSGSYGSEGSDKSTYHYESTNEEEPTSCSL